MTIKNKLDKNIPILQLSKNTTNQKYTTKKKKKFLVYLHTQMKKKKKNIRKERVKRSFWKIQS